MALTGGLRTVLRARGRGGTSLPGMLADRLDSALIQSLATELGPTVVVVGTNGKTTTARLVARVLTATLGRAPIANRSGANLRQGVASSLLEASNLRGRLRQPGRPAVFEVDELALPSILEIVEPAAIVMTNLFRDQLDRYGEVDTIVARWSAAFATLTSGPTLVACSDDPRLEQLARRSGLPTNRYGLDDTSPDAAALQSGRFGAASATGPAPDAVACDECGAILEFGWRSIGHLGDYRCPNGHIRRPVPDVRVAARPPADADPDPADPSVTRYLFSTKTGSQPATIHLAGASGGYDAAAAVAAAITVGVDLVEAVRALDGATPAFGRLEEVQVDGRRVILALAKNPASLTESATIAGRTHPDGVLIGLSDNPADGRDVSWIWDVDFDPLVDVPFVGLTGTRSNDLAVRLKYSARPGGDPWPIVRIEPLADRALTAMIECIPPGGTLAVLATYTSLLYMRQHLHRLGVAPAAPR